MDEKAIPVGETILAGFLVRCPGCDHQAPAPETGAGRTIWGLPELRDATTVRCEGCGAEFAVAKPANVEWRR